MRWDRHDNDRKMPRTTAEIYDLNRALSKKMEDIFVKQGIPVIPSIGAFYLRLRSVMSLMNNDRK